MCARVRVRERMCVGHTQYTHSIAHSEAMSRVVCILFRILSSRGNIDNNVGMMGNWVLELPYLRVVRIVAVVAVTGVIRQRVHNGA